jgi:hypothetical protein
VTELGTPRGRLEVTYNIVRGVSSKGYTINEDKKRCLERLKKAFSNAKGLSPSVKDLTIKQLRDKIVAFLELWVKAKEHAWASSDQRWNGHTTNNGKLVDKCARIQLTHSQCKRHTFTSCSSLPRWGKLTKAGFAEPT